MSIVARHPLLPDGETPCGYFDHQNAANYMRQPSEEDEHVHLATQEGSLQLQSWYMTSHSGKPDAKVNQCSTGVHCGWCLHGSGELEHAARASHNSSLA